MARLYADENVRKQLVDELRAIGIDVFTAQDDGRANQKIPDVDVLVRAIALSRAVLTSNRRDYHKLHRITSNHDGIIAVTFDVDDIAVADRVRIAIAAAGDLKGKLIRITRPQKP